MKTRTWAFAIGSLLVVSAPAASRAEDPAVPPAFQDLYESLNAQLKNFAARLPASASAGYDTRFAVALVAPDANRGLALFGPRTPAGVDLELDAVKGLGNQAVTVTIGFPALYEPFYQWNGDPQDYQRMVSFYRDLAARIHQRGLKLIVESQALFPGYSSAAGSRFRLGAYYQTLSQDAYLAGRSANINNVITLVQPDYLLLNTEPDSEAKATGQKLPSTADGDLAEIQYFLSHLPPGGKGRTQLGAGAGTWTRDGRAYIENLSAKTDLDFIDMHVHPVNRQFLNNLLIYADIVASHGKRVSVSEAWLAKERDPELRAIDFEQHSRMIARDVFSFWAPLDELFLEDLTRIAQWKNFVFVAAGFRNFYLFAYLPYDGIPNCPVPPDQSCTPEQLVRDEMIVLARAKMAGQYSRTGLKYKALIAR